MHYTITLLRRQRPKDDRPCPLVDVAARMRTTQSAVSRLESGVGTRPRVRTIEKYAVAVGAVVEIRVRTQR
jgi:hypothetical protein